jgi:hypothetical protein
MEVSFEGSSSRIAEEFRLIEKASSSATFDVGSIAISQGSSEVTCIITAGPPLTDGEAVAVLDP